MYIVDSLIRGHSVLIKNEGKKKLFYHLETMAFIPDISVIDEQITVILVSGIKFEVIKTNQRKNCISQFLRFAIPFICQA